MKNCLKIALIVAFVTIVGTAYAQKPLKVAYIDSQELMQSMPEVDSVKAKLQKIYKDYQDMWEEMQVELNRKSDEYQKNQATWTDLVKESKMKDLSALNQRLQESQQEAQERVPQEQAKLMQPIQDKVKKAIEAVAKEQGVTYVLDAGVILYKAADAQNIIEQVRQKLGITTAATKK